MTTADHYYPSSSLLITLYRCAKNCHYHPCRHPCHTPPETCRRHLPSAACRCRSPYTLPFPHRRAIRHLFPPHHTHHNFTTQNMLIHLQIRRRADAAYEAATPSRRRRERGRDSHYRSCSRSPYRAESSRKRRRSPSPQDQESPSDRREKRVCNNAKSSKNSEFFQSGAGPRGGVCAACLGRHDHPYAKCKGAKLWDGTPSAARKYNQ